MARCLSSSVLLALHRGFLADQLRNKLLAACWPMSTKIGRFGPLWAEFGQTWAELGQNWLKLAEFG